MLTEGENLIYQYFGRFILPFYNISKYDTIALSLGFIIFHTSWRNYHIKLIYRIQVQIISIVEAQTNIDHNLSWNNSFYKDIAC